MGDAQPAALTPERTEFEAAVTGVDGSRVRLSESYFYAASGGQPADRGFVGDHRVTGVRSVDGEHVHELADEPDLAVGETVACSVDPEFRAYCRRAHTASHLLYGAARRLLADLGYGGFDIDEDRVRVDFRTSTDVDDDGLVELERLVERCVWDSRTVSWESVPVEEARADGRVSFNEATEEGVFADAETVRVVTVEGWDWAACGGTHVRNTAEVGPVAVLERSNPGEGLTRVEFAVGPTAVEHRAERHRSLAAAARTAEVAPTDLPGAVERLREDRDRLRADLATARERAVEQTIADLPVVETDRGSLAAGVVEGVGPNDVEAPVRTTAGAVADAVAVVGVDGATFVVAGAGEDGDGRDGAGDGAEPDGPDAAALVEAVTEEFGGGGGGTREFAQGGGLDADPETVVDFLRGRAT
jgi:alanyl-tRNA synthetase